ncbi:dimethyl sulfoxide reductase anchor subunit family protein [Eggerthella lenta]|uniref:dimethyl sulfoxide reductase anchor subunit family protein n=1 Tax=Eggerthella lenta TaxID=84112 RepID=UPI000DF8407F|nr:DmsC/YnfH family molybdoenzyme membrane anchor subunit [Eggerthella lenta]MCB6526864.1 dimethyl sulfoxide reductase anchor subunit [Eggerthella lenta]MCG4876505.1 dimethyl sulfoxide reductase anchor subunit [Eggerthella lenta]MCQ5240746.1 dimethyl sulfoxide reductase anchor subunit [Eggerthella lenta]RDC11313.1 DMSO reductase [Eggerthella lenta]
MEIQWALVLFTVISGAGAWLFACSMLGYLLKKDAAPSKMETIVAFVLVAVGGCMSVAHLSHVDRILEALNHPTSGIFVEAAMIGVLCVILAVYFVLVVRGSSEKARTAVGVLALLVGVVFTYACGSSYMMEGRPAWNNVALPLAYFGTAASAGAGLNLLLKAVQKRDGAAVSFAGLLAVVGGALGLVLAAAFCISAGAYVAAADNGAMAGTVALFVALAAVVACGAVALKQPKSALALGAIALVAGVAAATLLRVVMWLIGTPFMDFFLMALD